MALPASCPGYQACSTAATSSEPRHLDRPAGLQHDDGAGLARATAATSSSCRPGSAMSSRSLPSVSHSPLRPTKTSADLGAAAASAAAAISASPSGLPMPTRKAAKVRLRDGLVANSMTTSHGRGRPRARPRRRPRRSPPRRRSSPASSRSRRPPPAGRRRGPARAPPRRRRRGAVPLASGTKRPGQPGRVAGGIDLAVGDGAEPEGLRLVDLESHAPPGRRGRREAKNSTLSGPVSSGSKRWLVQPSA